MPCAGRQRLDNPVDLASEVVSSLLGLDPEPLIREARRRAGSEDWGPFLDAAETVAAEWGVLSREWREAAKAILLARIHAEAAGSWKRMAPLRGIEREVRWQALRLLYERYILRTADGLASETPDDMVRRVAGFVASAERIYGGDARGVEKAFYEIISSLRFLPNSPTLMNAGTRFPQLAACFVVPVGDDIDEILDAVKVSVWIFKTGAGTGYDFTPLRPRGSPIRGTGGTSSGPVSFMKLFDTVADVIREGGRRRAAMMGILHDWHPDLLEFIESKCSSRPSLENFNISVALHDAFLEKALRGGKWHLYSPAECSSLIGSTSEELEKLSAWCKPSASIDAAEVLNRIADCAWASGDPGVVFIDTINRHNPTPSLGKIRATNPCGETPLLDWEACNLGSINLARYVREGKIDWELLARDVELAVRFLDNVIDVSWYPDKRIERAVKRTRKVGLGVMGWADALAKLGVPYDSHDALFLADKVMEFIAYHARAASNRLAEERGAYPAFATSIHREGRFNFEPQVPAEQIYDPSKVSERARELVEDRPALDWEELRISMRRGTRNATVTTIAPTGSISIIAGASSGIEPFFALVYVRRSAMGAWVEVHPMLQRWLEENGLMREDILVDVASRGGGIRWAPWAPPELKRSMPTALEIGWEWHVRMQAAFQRWVDNAVSKTINMPSTATPNDVREAFLLAWRLGCKGITVFRDKSRPEQVLEVGEKLRAFIRKPPKIRRRKDRHVYSWMRIGKKEVMIVHEDYAGGCPSCDT
ncbi:MAG: adenosylcobalamin-dependent ribonucleoside-diphosphate reductase [Thermoproteota archaeon]